MTHAPAAGDARNAAFADFALGAARDAGAGALITLAVFPGNSRARELYERAGFREDLLRLAKRVR